MASCMKAVELREAHGDVEMHTTLPRATRRRRGHGEGIRRRRGGHGGEGHTERAYGDAEGGHEDPRVAVVARARASTTAASDMIFI